MTGLQALNLFLHLQVLVALGALLALALRGLGRLGVLPISSVGELKLHYLLLGFLPILFVIARGSGEELRLEPFARVMETGVVNAEILRRSVPSPKIVIGEPSKSSAGIALESCGWLSLALFLAGVAAVLRDYWLLWLALRRCVTFRRIGCVRIAILEGAVSPFSVLGLSSAWVVLPPGMLHSLAIRHELQHHRARDTLWCHLLAPLRALCFFHPLRAAWSSALSEIQELACDEALVSSQKNRKISVRDYSACLVSAAETAVRERSGRVYAAAPSLFSNRRLLKRRIETMYRTKKQQKKWVVTSVGLTLVCCLAASAGATSNLVVDSRIRMEDAEKMAEHARRTTEFPIAVNEKVLKYLNFYLGSARGREVVRSSVANLEALRSRFEAKLALHSAPEELFAVGMIESGYRNLPSSANTVSGAAGIWQFIASTARVFGLRVDSQVDERLDIDLETDAAFRYLVANKARFNDWLLAVMAYNMGERSLENAILKAGTRDPWELVKRGFENDSDYLPKFMAALLILKNPQALK